MRGKKSRYNLYIREPLMCRSFLPIFFFPTATSSHGYLKFVVFHNTDTHIYILSVTFALLIHNKLKKNTYISVLSLVLVLLIHNKQTKASRQGWHTGPHVWWGILGTSSNHTFTTRLPHVRLCGEFTTQTHVWYVSFLQCTLLSNTFTQVHLSTQRKQTYGSTGEIDVSKCIW